MILLAIILFLTILEAVHEGLASRYRNTGKPASWVPGVIEAIKLVGIAAMVPFLLWYTGYDEYLKPHSMWKFWQVFLPQYILGFVFIRYAIFDIFYNICAGNRWSYIGNTKLIDRLIRKITAKVPWGYWSLVTRSVLGLAGISLILKI